MGFANRPGVASISTITRVDWQTSRAFSLIGPDFSVFDNVHAPWDRDCAVLFTIAELDAKRG